MSDTPVTTPGLTFPFMLLPYEIRNRIYRFAAVRPDGYIGQADNRGRHCALGVIQATFHGLFPQVEFDQIHAPTKCIHPDHEKKQLAKDFRKYGCLNIASVCRQMYKELTTVFFESNGFELRDASAFVPFVIEIQIVRTNLIRNLRIFHPITLNVEDVEAIFEPSGVSGKTFSSLLEDNYLNDPTSYSTLLHVLKALELCNNLQQFDLVYRLEVPAEHFHIFNAMNANYIIQHAEKWRGQPMQWDLHTKNVLQKLRQDEKMRQDEPLAVEVEEFKVHDLTNEVATASGCQQLLLDVYPGAMVDVCLKHAEDCIEDAVQNRG